MAYIENFVTDGKVLAKITKLEQIEGWECLDYGHAWDGYFITWSSKSAGGMRNTTVDGRPGYRQEFKTIQAFYAYLNKKLGSNR